MHKLWQDVRYGFRALLKAPGFACIAMIALALGIGANSAIFSVLNGVLLEPLPYANPGQLAMVWLDNRRQSIREDITSYPNFLDWRDRNKTFQGMAGVTNYTVNLTGVGEPEELRASSVSPNFFQLMGAPPVRGRGFIAEEEQPGKDNVVILGHELWSRRFGGDPGILNRTISLNGVQRTVVGISPPGFHFPEKAEIWLPLAPSERRRAARGSFWLPVIGRLKPGVTRAEAQADMDMIAAQMEKEFPNINAGYGVNIVPLQEQIVGNLRASLLVLLAAVGFVLLIACANVANLLLARAAVREKEVAIRAALGATRGRILRQLLTESLLLSVLGGSLGLLFAWMGLTVLLRLGPQDLPRLENIHIDARVLWFTFGVSLLTGVLFGLAPALQTSQPDFGETLKEGGGGSTSRRSQRIRSLFIVGEIALTLVLLTGAGLLMRSFWRLQQVDPGFKIDHILTMELGLTSRKYPEGPQAVAFFKQLQERLAAIPGVESASATTTILLPKLANSSGFTIENRPPDPAQQQVELPFDSIQPNYFQTMGIQLLRGRAFTEQDSQNTPQVAIVNETFANRFFPNEDPVGKRFTFGDGRANSNWISVTGVVRDTRRQGLDAPVRIESWMPLAQAPSLGMQMVIRTTGDPLSIVGAVREAVWSLDRDLPIPRLQTLEQIMAQSVAHRRLNMLLLATFAAVALALAAVGIYGVMSYVISQRTREIGVRMALGAEARDVIRLMVGQGMKLALIGVSLGVVAAFGLTRMMTTLLFGVSPSDPLTFLAIALLLVTVAFLACWVPARKATKVDPMTALRWE